MAAGPPEWDASLWAGFLRHVHACGVSTEDLSRFSDADLDGAAHAYLASPAVGAGPVSLGGLKVALRRWAACGGPSSPPRRAVTAQPGHAAGCSGLQQRRRASLQRLADSSALTPAQLAAAEEAVRCSEARAVSWDPSASGAAAAVLCCPACGGVAEAAVLRRLPTLRSLAGAGFSEPSERYSDGTVWSTPLPRRGRCAVVLTLALPAPAAAGALFQRPCVVGVAAASARRKGTHVGASCWAVAADVRDRVGPMGVPLGAEAAFRGGSPTLFRSGDVVTLLVDGDRGTMSLRVNDVGYGVVHTTLPQWRPHHPPSASAPDSVHVFAALRDIGCVARISSVEQP
eukprot:TRINITY_DN16838_c0_g1_i4.p1 TRINITY_DN16838_c0_g1~~TRINITY_DN16838_c0_g1_i4.p1  ORF type:complete len:354 (+),score=109.61 TRINITY_DN16838_c0_g1_i4:35-1063(+)